MYPAAVESDTKERDAIVAEIIGVAFDEVRKGDDYRALTRGDTELLIRLIAPRLEQAGHPASREQIAEGIYRASLDTNRYIAIRDEARALIERIEQLETFIADAPDETPGETLYAAMREDVVCWERMLELNQQIPASTIASGFGRPLPIDGAAERYVASLRDALGHANEMIRENSRQAHEQRRSIRIAVRRYQREDADRRAAEAGPRTCAACGHREARVDDLCKRCAHAAGTLPHGKIGTG